MTQTESFIIFVRLPTELRLEAFPGETTDPLIKKWLKGNLPDLIDNSASVRTDFYWFGRTTRLISIGS